MATETDPAGAGAAGPETDRTTAHPGLGSAAHAALGAAGEAAAFFAGAPIAGAADAAIGLGEVVTDREAKLEEAITGRHAPADPQNGSPTRARNPLLWVVLAMLVVAVLVWLFRAR